MPEQVMIVDVDPWVLKRAGIEYKSVNTGWKRGYLISSEDLQYLQEDQYLKVDACSFFTRKTKRLDAELRTRRVK